MPDSQVFIAPFIGGLNTETSSIQDAPLNTSDELNCTIYPEGIRGRRYGIAIERDGQSFEVPEETQSSYSGFYWKNVGKTAKDLIVQQAGSHLYFYDASTKPFSKSKEPDSVDLSKYVTDTANFYSYPVNYSSGNGKLMVVSKYMKPLYISYDFDNQEFKVNIISLKYRDLEGLDDGLKVDAQPTDLSNEHEYNLLNQGWTRQQIEAFHKKISRYPSNNLQWFIGKDDSGAFNTEKLLATYFGNTPAPKGHYILDYFDRDRGSASGILLGTARQASYSLNQNWGYSSRSWHVSPIRDISVVIPSSVGTSKTCVVNFSTLITKIAKSSLGTYRGNARMKVWGLKEDNWIEVFSDVHYFSGPEIYTLEYPTNDTAYEQYKVTAEFYDGSTTSDAGGCPTQLTVSLQLAITEDGNPFPHTHGLDMIADVAYMSGKYFYLSGDTVLFSQTIKEDSSGFDKCYQDADPTSEEISDLLPTDGGYVKFQTMGDGIALEVFNRGVIVFGRDIVFGLISPSTGRFTATEYDTVELSRAGIIGPRTVVQANNVVYYWSPLGVFSIGINYNTDNILTASNISQNTIQSFYNDLPKYSKEHCQASFDYVNNRIYWFYPLDVEDLSKLNGCLVYDLTYNAFYPFKISDGGKVVAVFDTVDSFEVQPSQYVRANGARVVAGGKYIIAQEQVNDYNRYVAIQHNIITEDGKLSFGDFNSREFIDWDTTGYDSYMVSKPIVLQDTYLNKQVPILQTLFKRTEERELRTPRTYLAASGAYLRMRWGWSMDSKSNRWDLIQNSYRHQKDFLNDEYVESRIHVRGRGKSFQIEVRNDSNKDFKLAGINLLVRQ